MSLAMIESELIKSRPYFHTLHPAPYALIRGRAAKIIGFGVKTVVDVLRGKRCSAAEAGEMLGGAVVGRMTAPFRNKIESLHRQVQHWPRRDMFRKNGIGGRSWINTPGRYRMVMVFHDANHAGAHIDVHIGRFSMIYRVKPEIYQQLRYNNDGYLTARSKQLLVDQVRDEVATGARVPQNLDHTVTNAKASWVGGSRDDVGYGAGLTRQVIAETDVEVIKTGPGRPIEMYAPSIDPYRLTYIHQLYSGGNRRAPILVWGRKTAGPPALADRLHLKLIDPADTQRLEDKADLATSTIKYDGSACYVVITSKGTTVWSPRASKVTGSQIEYTAKVNGIVEARSDETIVAMGELLFRRKTRWPWQQGEYLPQAQQGGLLNAHEPLPDDVEPEIRLYRIDRVGRTTTIDEDFWTNRVRQTQVAGLHERLDVVELADPDTAYARGFEGVVVAPVGGSVVDGFKVKFWGDEADWRIDTVELRRGPNGGTAGVIRCTSLESGKEFKLGPGQIGDNQLTDDMMANPDAYEGSVVKVASRHGHEGRASKIQAFHTDK